MLNITVDNNTRADELDLIGNFLKELSKLRTPKEASPTTQSPKKTKAQPVTLTTLEPSGALPESAPEPVVAAPAAAAEPEQAQYTDTVSDGGLDPRNEPEALDLVALRAAIEPIMKVKKVALVALVKKYGESLPKIDPIHYPEILAKAKEL